MFSDIVLFGCLAGLCGEKIMEVDISWFFKYLGVRFEDNKFPHYIVPLIGRIKGKLGEKYHLLPVP